MKRKPNIDTPALVFDGEGFGMLTQFHRMITTALSFYQDHLLLRLLRV